MSQSWTASEPRNSGNPDQQWCLKIFARIYGIDIIYDLYALFGVKTWVSAAVGMHQCGVSQL